MGEFGAIAGVVAGGLGGFFGSSARKKAAEQFRRRQQTGITNARNRTEERVSALLDNPLISAANDFILDSFSNEGDDALSNQFRKNLQVSQQSRGIRRSVAGAVAEASSLAAFRQNFRASLLPQAQSFGTLGERFRQSIFSSELPSSIAFETGAAIPGVSQLDPQSLDPAGFDPVASIFQGAVTGGAGGFQVGQQLENNSNAFTNIQRQNDLLERLTGGGGGGNFDFSRFPSTGSVRSLSSGAGSSPF